MQIYGPIFTTDKASHEICKNDTNWSSYKEETNIQQWIFFCLGRHANFTWKKNSHLLKDCRNGFVIVKVLKKTNVLLEKIHYHKQIVAFSIWGPLSYSTFQKTSGFLDWSPNTRTSIQFTSTTLEMPNFFHFHNNVRQDPKKVQRFPSIASNTWGSFFKDFQ